MVRETVLFLALAWPSLAQEPLVCEGELAPGLFVGGGVTQADEQLRAEIWLENASALDWQFCFATGMDVGSYEFLNYEGSKCRTTEQTALSRVSCSVRVPYADHCQQDCTTIRLAPGSVHWEPLEYPWTFSDPDPSNRYLAVAVVLRRPSISPRSWECYRQILQLPLSN